MSAYLVEGGNRLQGTARVHGAKNSVLLESGKTSFINFTVAQDYFQIDGPTLLITTVHNISCRSGRK